ncbi:hypothetical protein [Ottowia sp. VDI28]|uniref:TubC N-terminal docking domain-related protein n=1 Tax=Ottowia sp. VDI28 TaxID=3133968 RepID=UPI003C2F6C63
MNSSVLLRNLHEARLTVHVRDGRLLVQPAELLTDDHRAAIRAHKPELLEYLAEVEQVTAQLLETAMRCCDYHGDGDKAREEMRRQCTEIPCHLRPELLRQLQESYPIRRATSAPEAE